MRKLLSLSALLCAGLAPVAALAGFEVCNDSEARQSIAIGYKSGDTWVSEGWWIVEPGDCSEPVKGDLKNRYYYLRAQAKGWEFDDERIPFCTQTKAFTIEGDEDCVERDYDKRYFRKIDTGKTAKHYTVQLSAFVRPDPTEPAERGYKASETEDRAEVKQVAPPVKSTTPPAASSPPPPPKKKKAAAGFAPGTYGDPWDGRAIVQGCMVQDGFDHCAFFADGMMFMAARGGPSEPGALSVLSALDPGTPVMVKGDITEFYDSSVEVALSSVQVAKFGRADVALHDLQGAWYSVDDPASQFTVLGVEREWTYDGEPSGSDRIDVSTRCGRHEGGLYIGSFDPETGDTLCYSIEKLADFSLELMYIDNANFLEYRKLD